MHLSFIRHSTHNHANLSGAIVPTLAESGDVQGVLDGIRSYSLSDSSFGYEARQAIESALMVATIENIICYFYGNQGHRTSDYVIKKQQKQHQGAGKYSNQYGQGHPPRRHDAESNPIHSTYPPFSELLLHYPIPTAYYSA